MHQMGRVGKVRLFISNLLNSDLDESYILAFTLPPSTGPVTSSGGIKLNFKKHDDDLCQAIESCQREKGSDLVTAHAYASA